jgi:ABC-type multidrug transport system fused ATPase/permease subunit
LGFDLIGLWNAAMDCVGVIMGAVMVCPTLTIIAALLLCAVIWYTKRYVAAVREIKQLEAISRSTVNEHLNFSMHGLTTIQAFCRTEDYTNLMHAKIDQQAKTSWHLYLLNRWLTFRINVLGALFSLSTLLFVVSSRSMTASFAGFALVFTNHLCHALVTLSRTYATAEMDFSAVERVLEYTHVPTEDGAGANAPTGWPMEGRLSVTNLTVAYSPELSPVLHNISFDVEPGRRIGIVGRTGAGKSSLALAIFRCLEAREGAIWIDGIDISTIKLRHLRSRLAMIPQNPILFKGTVRSNLDPFSQHSDESLIQALKRVFWDSPEALDTPVSDGGSNLSCGQRQLLCLGRAVLSRPALLVMDEATSAVDRATDELIQRSIRSEIGGRVPTLLVIAHRIQTVVDFDRVLVLDEGRVVEYGSPRELMQLGKGFFRQLVDHDIDKQYLYAQMRIGSNSVN